MIEVQLLVIELINGDHVLHALFEDLHLSFKFNLLLSLLVSICAHRVLEVLRVGLLLALALDQELLLGVLVVLEKFLDLLSVACEDLAPLAVELRLNISELGAVVLAHSNKLVSHL